MMIMRRIESRAIGDEEDVFLNAHGKWDCTVVISLPGKKDEDWSCERCMCDQGEGVYERHFLSLSILTQTSR